MKSSIIKHSVKIAGHKTSVSLEDAFWSRLKTIALESDVTLSDVLTGIETSRHKGNLSSAIRLFVLDHARLRPPTWAGKAVIAPQINDERVENRK
jgi:predicted DNA-binding ribbon-helix-helix protein